MDAFRGPPEEEAPFELTGIPEEDFRGLCGGPWEELLRLGSPLDGEFLGLWGTPGFDRLFAADPTAVGRFEGLSGAAVLAVVVGLLDPWADPAEDWPLELRCVSELDVLGLAREVTSGFCSRGLSSDAPRGLGAEAAECLDSASLVLWKYLRMGPLGFRPRVSL